MRRHSEGPYPIMLCFLSGLHRRHLKCPGAAGPTKAETQQLQNNVRCLEAVEPTEAETQQLHNAVQGNVERKMQLLWE